MLRLPRLAPRRLGGRTMILSVAMSLILGAPAAFALLDDEAHEPTLEDAETGDTTPSEPEVGEAGPFAYSFDGQKGVLILDVTGTKAGEPAPNEDPDAEALVCIPVESEGDEAATEPLGDVTDGSDADTEEPALPDGCLVIDVTGPNGQINHGSVVSNTVHALKEIRDQLDGPLGHYIREIAKSDLGQDGGGDDAGTDDNFEPSDDDDKDATEKGKDKHTSDDDTSNGGNGGRPDHAGPPEHAGQGGPPAHAGGNKGGK